MHGRVIQAQPQEDGSVALSLRGATMLDESLLPPMVVQQVEGREIVYLAAPRSSRSTTPHTFSASRRTWHRSNGRLPTLAAPDRCCR